MKKTFATIAAAAMLALTGCLSEAEQIREKAETVKACTEAGGDWYNVKGWGDGCHFDTRKDGAK